MPAPVIDTIAGRPPALFFTRRVDRYAVHASIVIACLFAHAPLSATMPILRYHMFKKLLTPVERVDGRAAHPTGPIYPAVQSVPPVRANQPTGCPKLTKKRSHSAGSGACKLIFAPVSGCVKVIL